MTKEPSPETGPRSSPLDNRSRSWLNVVLRLVKNLRDRPYLSKVFRNVGWLSFERVVRVVSEVAVGIWMARYLGPNQFGLLNFSLALVVLLSPIGSLGLQSIMIRDLVEDRSLSSITLGTGSILQLVGGMVAVLILNGVIQFMRPGDETATLVVAILSLTLVFKAASVVRYWYESQVEVRYAVWAESSVRIFMAAATVALIVSEASLIWFAWFMTFQAIGIAFMLLLTYRLTAESVWSWAPRMVRARELLKDGWPLMLSGLLITVYLKIDQIMLGEMIGDGAVGIYAAAVKISEVWYFVPVAIVASVFPAIIRAKGANERVYEDRMQALYDALTVLAFVVAIPVSFTSAAIVALLFGNEYASAGPVLAVHVWAGLFVSLGVASSKWLVVENLQILSLQRAMLGMLLNVGINLLLIPSFGPSGAAYATIVSYAGAAFAFDALHPKTRGQFQMKVRALNLLLAARRLTSLIRG